MLTRVVDKIRNDGVVGLWKAVWKKVKFDLWVARVKRGATVQFQNVQLRLDAPITDLARGGVYEGTYEAPEIQLIGKHLPRDIAVLELGGGIGITSTIIRSHLNSDQTQVTVEPIPEACDVIKQQQSANGHSYGIEQAAYHPDRDEVEVAVQYDHFTLSALNKDKGEIIQVPGVSLCELCSRHSIDNFALVADIEGAEEILIEIESDVLRNKCECIIIEFHPEQCDIPKVKEILSEAGFVCVETQNSVSVYNNAHL